MKIFYSPLFAERIQFRFPRSKRRRIRKKWAHRAGNFRYRPQIFAAAGVLYAHPYFRAELEAAS